MQPISPTNSLLPTTIAVNYNSIETSAYVSLPSIEPAQPDEGRLQQSIRRALRSLNPEDSDDRNSLACKALAGFVIGMTSTGVFMAIASAMGRQEELLVNGIAIAILVASFASAVYGIYLNADSI